MKATAKQTVIDYELGIVHEGETVDLNATQQKRIGDLFVIEKSKRTTKKKPETIPPVTTEK